MLTSFLSLSLCCCVCLVSGCTSSESEGEGQREGVSVVTECCVVVVLCGEEAL